MRCLFWVVFTIAVVWKHEVSCVAAIVPTRSLSEATRATASVTHLPHHKKEIVETTPHTTTTTTTKKSPPETEAPKKPAPTTEKPTTSTITTTTTTTTATAPPPSLNITDKSCLIKGIYIYIDVDATMVRGSAENISMCYTAPDLKNCNTFPTCEKIITGNKLSITCETFAKWDSHAFKLYLVNKGVDKVLVYDKYIPLIQRKECKFKEEDVFTVKQVNATADSVLVLVNLTKPTYAQIEDATFNVEGSGKDIMVNCIPDSETTAFCNISNLAKCTKYKGCVSLTTVFFGQTQKCIDVVTDSPAVEKPRNLVFVVLTEYIPFKSTVFNWEGPKLNTSNDLYHYTYQYKYKRYEMTTNNTHISVECDLNSNFTVKLCTNCGCSEAISAIVTRGIHFGKWNVVSTVKNQVDKWQKKNSDRMSMWTGIVGGMGGGFLIAIAAVFIYRRQKNRNRKSLLRDTQSVKYTNFSCNIEKNSTDIQ